jgi:DNA-binding NarL/FixJ family response regulator
MKPLSVIVAQNEPLLSEALAHALQGHFKTVAVAASLDDVRLSVPKHRAEAAVIDLELASLAEVEALRREFPELTVVCTHRLADEDMWTAALDAGAQDCCHPSDVRSIVHAATRTKVMARTTAA